MSWIGQIRNKEIELRYKTKTNSMSKNVFTSRGTTMVTKDGPQILVIEVPEGAIPLPTGLREQIESVISDLRAKFGGAEKVDVLEEPNCLVVIGLCSKDLAKAQSVLKFKDGVPTVASFKAAHEVVKSCGIVAVMGKTMMLPKSFVMQEFVPAGKMLGTATGLMTQSWHILKDTDHNIWAQRPDGTIGIISDMDVRNKLRTVNGREMIPATICQVPRQAIFEALIIDLSESPSFHFDVSSSAAAH